SVRALKSIFSSAEVDGVEKLLVMHSVYAGFLACKRHQATAVAAVAVMRRTHPSVPVYVPIHLPNFGHRSEVQLFGIKNKTAAKHAGQEWKTLRGKQTVNSMGKSHIEKYCWPRDDSVKTPTSRSPLEVSDHNTTSVVRQRRSITIPIATATAVASNTGKNRPIAI